MEQLLEVHMNLYQIFEFMINVSKILALVHKSTSKIVHKLEYIAMSKGKKQNVQRKRKRHDGM